MENQTIDYIDGKNIDSVFEDEWCSLFSRCYKSPIYKAKLLLRKYKLNESRFCILRHEGCMVACYSGLKLKFNQSYIFLSTDTMSDGTVGGASIILGRHIYNSLLKENVFAVCGYPNAKILKIRQKRLGWTILGGMNLYFSLPVLYKFFRRQKSQSLWNINRPKGGFFSKKIFGISLLGRDSIYPNGFSLIATLSAYRPGLFFFRIPEFLIPKKIFGYKLLVDNELNRSIMNNSTLHLDLDTIDLP